MHPNQAQFSAVLRDIPSNAVKGHVKISSWISHSSHIVKLVTKYDVVCWTLLQVLKLRSMSLQHMIDNVCASNVLDYIKSADACSCQPLMDACLEYAAQNRCVLCCCLLVAASFSACTPFASPIEAHLADVSNIATPYSHAMLLCHALVWTSGTNVH